MLTFLHANPEKTGRILRAAAIGVTLVFLLALLTQTAFAQTTYVITDGSRVLVHTTNATDPRAVLGEAGLRLGAADTYTTQSGDGTAEIQIQRSQVIYIDYYGEPIQTLSNGETVGQLLTRLNLTWEPEDTLSATPDTATFDGMELSIAQVLHQEQTYTAVIHHDTRSCTDESLPAGTEVVRTEGVDGEMLCTARVTYVNGVETERTLLSSVVIRHPVEEIISVGARLVPEDNPLDPMPVITDHTITLPTGEVLTYDKVITSLATAYCDKGRTATGTQARVGAIAVDPRYIPYGTRMFIMSSDGEYIYGVATAEDCGSLEHIVGTRIDLHFDTYAECRQFGARDCLVYFLT